MSPTGEAKMMCVRPDSKSRERLARFFIFSNAEEFSFVD